MAERSGGCLIRQRHLVSACHIGQNHLLIHHGSVLRCPISAHNRMCPGKPRFYGLFRPGWARMR
jgi:hypothetical protein